MPNPESAPSFKVVPRQERPNMWGQRNKEFLGGRESSPVAKALRLDKGSKLGKFIDKHWEDVTGEYGEKENAQRLARLETRIDKFLDGVVADSAKTVEKRVLANSGDEIRRQREYLDLTEEGWHRKAGRRLKEMVGATTDDEPGSERAIFSAVIEDARKVYDEVRELDTEIAKLQKETAIATTEARLRARGKGKPTEDAGEADETGEAPADPLLTARKRIFELGRRRTMLFRQLGDNEKQRRKIWDALDWERETEEVLGTETGRTAVKKYILESLAIRAKNELELEAAVRAEDEKRRRAVKQMTRGEATGGMVPPTRLDGANE